MKTQTLQVPGASLYYEVRGAGPVLLMIPGGPMDADGFKDLADRLSDDYTVVTYDCRGNSRSPMQGSWDDLTAGLFAGDARRLLDAVGADQADVLGSSGGATYALDLVARYPGRVRTLVAHEPPVSELLPDAARYHALNELVGETYRSEGTFARRPARAVPRWPWRVRQPSRRVRRQGPRGSGGRPLVLSRFS
ncbi:MAG: alpha/beta fold hydrolase [Streptosporangiaceae bacterium]